MPHLLKLKSGKLILPFSMEDLLEEIDSCMGPEVRQFITDWEMELEQEREADRADLAEAEKELEQGKDHQHRVLCDLREETDALEDLLQEDRLDRKKIQKAVDRICQMLYREK